MQTKTFAVILICIVTLLAGVYYGAYQFGYNDGRADGSKGVATSGYHAYAAGNSTGYAQGFQDGLNSQQGVG